MLYRTWRKVLAMESTSCASLRSYSSSLYDTFEVMHPPFESEWFIVILDAADAGLTDLFYGL